MIDVVELQNEIIKNPEHIECILENMGYYGIQDKGKYYSFYNKGGDNPNACSILKNNLHYENFSHGESGSLITLVKNDQKCDFKVALDKISNWIGFKGSEYKKRNIKSPFGGFYKNITATNLESDIMLPTYDESILPPADCLSYLWLKDGVDLKTQERYGIRVDLNTDKIIIPARTIDSSLAGAKFRVNSNNIDHNKRWGMAINYPKSKIIWGANYNYDSIVNKRTVFVIEAEKSVLQLASMGFNLGVAIGGHSISDSQVRQIRMLFADRIIVAFDSDVCLEEAAFEAKKLLSNNNLIYKPKVGVIYDKSGLILDPESKVSPTDQGLSVFKILYNKCITWIN